MVFSFLVVGLLHLLLLLSAGVVGVSTATSSADGAAGNWLENCRSKGFDPWHLACATCDILASSSTGVDGDDDGAEKLKEACLGCCQPYKDGERQIRTKPYESAVLVLHRGGGSGSLSGGSGLPQELETFLKEDYPDLLKSKGADRLATTKDVGGGGVEDGMTAQEMEMMLLGMGGGRRSPAATLHFLEEKVPAGTGSSSEKERERVLVNAGKLAKESVVLDAGWKREDVKDMIQTLLAA